MKVKFLGMAEEDDNLKERIDNAGNIQGCSLRFSYINSGVSQSLCKPPN